MATLRKEIPVAAGATAVWQALRDFGQVHTKVAPGFLTDLKMDNGDRIVTFFNGMVARERLVTAWTTRRAGWSMRSSKAGRATTTPPSRSSPKATAAASCGRSICCPTNWRRRSGR